ncbi:MAG: hypothetical protein WC250_00500, partial [Candidatus Paceibacterota bacterium]
MKIILVGYGNVGKELRQVLSEHGFSAEYIVRTGGIYDSNDFIIDTTENFHRYLDKDSVVFISTPSIGIGKISEFYYKKPLEAGARVITCEKAFLANNWEFVKKYSGKIKYSATVGGDSGILDAISDYKGEIKEIRAVVNGTLNYIGEKFSRGIKTEEAYSEVVAKGFAEPGSKNFEEVIENELRDVLYKAVITVNHSKLFNRVVKPADVAVSKYQVGLRCSILINKNEIKAGFIKVPEDFKFPKGVNNCLYINGEKIIEGPGAGGR